MNWNLFGLNPKFKDFIEKYPNKTVLGVAWAMYWRFLVLVLALEMIIGIIFVLSNIIF
ncbi:hypothetical protein HYW60_00455 [Candidatus Kaiserbacteria bacterium]|nr:hypothetical protein [Candidatus Kaiserbacteria bacterium]